MQLYNRTLKDLYLMWYKPWKCHVPRRLKVVLYQGQDSIFRDRSFDLTVILCRLSDQRKSKPRRHSSTLDLPSQILSV